MHLIDFNIVNSYLFKSTEDKYHRYKSWEFCFMQFKDDNISDSHTLHLAFYLASWGMYRGSAGLLQTNYKVHEEVVKILLSSNYKPIRCDEKNDITENSLKNIDELKKELSQHYAKINFRKRDKASKGEKELSISISPTDTLLSKVILGTMACCPAYDRYFIAGIKNAGLVNHSFSYDSLKELLGFTNYHKEEIETYQKFVKTRTGIFYPKMKIIDMYFWHLGYLQKTI